jgi:hypothetical protein
MKWFAVSVAGSSFILVWSVLVREGECEDEEEANCGELRLEVNEGDLEAADWTDPAEVVLNRFGGVGPEGGLGDKESRRRLGGGETASW